MFLAEALLLRADLQKRQVLLTSRIRRVLLVQEGDQPTENPRQLLKRKLDESEELHRLVTAINHTNEMNTVETQYGVITITEALARREHLQRASSVLRDLAEGSNPKSSYSRSEIRSVPVMDAAKLQREADGYARDLRQLVLALQRADWLVEVSDYTPSELVSAAR